MHRLLKKQGVSEVVILVVVAVKYRFNMPSRPTIKVIQALYSGK